MCIKDMEEDALVAADLAFSTSSATGQEIQLSTTHTRITPTNRHDYVKLALHNRYVLGCTLNLHSFHNGYN